MYSTKLSGQVEEFGTSGFLYRSNKLMYDRTTNSLWNQFTGEPAVGTLVGQDIKLEILPVVVTTWGEWVLAHPDTSVLDLNTGIYHPEEYPPEWEAWSIYYPYRTSPDTMFPVWRQSDRLPTKGRVFGLDLGGEARAYPLDLLAENPVVNDQLGGEALVLVSSGKLGGVRAYRRDAYLFSIDVDAGDVDAGDVDAGDVDAGDGTPVMWTPVMWTPVMWTPVMWTPVMWTPVMWTPEMETAAQRVGPQCSWTSRAVPGGSRRRPWS